MSNTSEDTPGALLLPAVLDMAAAHSLRDILVEAVSLRADIVLDGAHVERVSTPVVQLLLSAARSAAAGSHDFLLTDPSPVLCAAFDDLGLSAELKRWSGE